MKPSATSTAPLHEQGVFRSHPEIWQKIAPLVHRKTLPKGDTILHHGDAATALWMVLRGWVKLTRQTPDGKESIVGLCTEGDLFGEAALFPHANYPYHAEVIEGGTELASIPAESIRAVLSKDAALSASIMALLNERVGQTQLQLEHMSTMSASQRLGCFLLRLCNIRGGVSQTLQIPVEKHLLAAYLGMKPETLSRSQQQLAGVGISVAGSQIQVANVTKLREFVCSSCSESGTCDAEDIS